MLQSTVFKNLDKIGYEKYLEKYPFNDYLNCKLSEYKKKTQNQ